jgi:hypothetical protein
LLLLKKDGFYNFAGWELCYALLDQSPLWMLGLRSSTRCFVQEIPVHDVVAPPYSPHALAYTFIAHMHADDSAWKHYVLEHDSARL